MRADQTSPDFQLLESLLLSSEGRLSFLEEHLARLRESALFFGFLCPLDDLRVRLLSIRPGAAPSKLRLALSRDGIARVMQSPLAPPPSAPRITLSKRLQDPGNPFLLHKTSLRGPYEEEHARLARETGCFETLFCNLRGELTEGSRSNLFLEQGEVLLTPPLSCGLLPGILRAQLLRSGRARECPLRPEDLLRGGRIFIGNSVRGLLEAHPCGSPA